MHLLAVSRLEASCRLVRSTTLDAICRVLDCRPGDILRWTADPPDGRHQAETG